MMKRLLFRIEISFVLWMLQWIKFFESIIGICSLGIINLDWFAKMAEKTIKGYVKTPARGIFLSACKNICANAFFGTCKFLNKEIS